MRTGLLALGIAAGFGVCAPALAQQIPSIQSGATRQYQIEANVDAIYDSNVAHTNGSLAGFRGIHPEEAIIHPTLTFDIIQPVGRQALFLNGEVGYDFHSENRRLNHPNSSVTGGGVVSLGPCHTTAFGRYVASQSDLSETAVVVTSNFLQTVTGGGSVACGAASGFNVQLSGQYLDATNSATIQSTADHNSGSGSLAFGYSNARLGQLQLVGTYSETNFPKRINSLGGVGDSYWNEVLGISYQRQFGQKIQVSASGGATILERDTAPPGVPRRLTNFNYQLGIDYRMSQRLDLQVHSARGFLPSNRPGKLFDLTTSTQADANYKLGTRFLINVGGTYEDITSNQDTAAPSPTPTKSRRITYYGGVHFHTGRRLSTSLEVRQEEKTTDVAAFNYSDTRVTLNLSTTF